MANSDRTLRQQIEKARKAQQENEQKHDVQLELPSVEREGDDHALGIPPYLRDYDPMD